MEEVIAQITIIRFMQTLNIVQGVDKNQLHQP